jgi:hypothetical protein
MRQILIIGGIVAMTPLMYASLSEELVSATQGQITLPTPGGAVESWEVWTALVGFATLIIALFVL